MASLFGSRFKNSGLAKNSGLDGLAAGRAQPITTAARHFVFDRPLKPPFPEKMKLAGFGMGCFWGAERKFWQLGAAIHLTAVGYGAGATPNPTYDEVCSGRTGHNETVLVVYDPDKISYEQLLQVFWENHDPTQYHRQGGDVGDQYRSAIYWTNAEQKIQATQSRDAYQRELTKRGLGAITTEIEPLPEFYYAEAYHQQYLAKNPKGYCGLGGTGVACPVGRA